MATPTVTTGTNGTITFSGFSAGIVSITPPPETVEVVDVTKLNSTFVESIPAGIPDNGTLEAVVHFEPNDANLPVIRTMATLVLTYPDASTYTMADAFLESKTPSELVRNGAMQCTMRWRINGIVKSHGS